jgi:tetratricopeptide (TPR) repeat protein
MTQTPLDLDLLRFAGETAPTLDEIAARLQGTITITGDGNVVGRDNTVTVTKRAGRDYIEVGSLALTLSRAALRALLTRYLPPAPPDPDTLPAPGALPPGARMPFQRNAAFTGRADPLKHLARALLYDGGATLITQAVQGMGGVGKTQLAVEFAYRYGRFFHGVHWLNAAQPGALGAEVAACGAPMAAAREVPWPQEQPAQITWTLAQWQRGGPRLVVLDNLEAVDAARTWLGRLGAGPVRVLLTARRADWPADLGLNPLRLDLFTPAESRAFLRTHLPEADAAALDGLAARLGHLPLALALAGRYLARHPRKTVDAYRAELDDALAHRSMRAWRADLGSPTAHDLDLGATFALSWEAVTDPAAQRLFRAAGSCAPNAPIPYDLLERAADLDQDACDEALSLLTGLGLLDLEAPADGPTVHPLLGEYARAIEAPAEATEPVLADLADALGSITREAGETGLPTRFQLLRPHVEQVAPLAEEAGLAQAGMLWNNLGYHLDDLADYEGARAAYARALRIFEQVLGLEHPNVATLVNNLGSVLKAQGDLAGARAAYARALRIDEAVYGPDHPNVARDVNNLGGVLQDQGDLAGARAAYERALRIWRLTYGDEHPQAATAHNNLGGVLQAQGNLAGARAAYARALRIDEAVYGPDHPTVARDVNNLGSVLKAEGDLAGARAAYARALRIDEAVYGPEHPNVATLVNNLGSVLQAQGDLAGARAAFARALRIDEAVYGPDHPSVATDVNNLGGVLQDQGDLAGARAMYERALHIFEQVLGPEHPNVATLVNNLGDVLRDQGDLAGARAAFARALRIDEAVYGPDHPEVARDVNNLGSVLQDQGDLAGARAAFARALRIDEAVYGPDHPTVARDLNNLGKILRDRGNLAEARTACERALRIREQTFGHEHPDTAQSLWWLGVLAQEEGKPKAARAYLQEALATFERFLPPDHPHIATVRQSLLIVDILEKLGSGDPRERG